MNYYIDFFQSEMELIYSASRDGFEADQFYSKCDNNPNTFIIIKSTNGNVFGGYTDQSWTCNYISKNDPNSFIFSFINYEKKTIKMICIKPNEAITCSTKIGPWFGEGHDLMIFNNSNTNTLSYSDLGFSYKHPDYVYESNEAQSFLAEIEIYTKK